MWMQPGERNVMKVKPQVKRNQWKSKKCKEEKEEEDVTKEANGLKRLKKMEMAAAILFHELQCTYSACLDKKMFGGWRHLRLKVNKWALERRPPANLPAHAKNCVFVYNLCFILSLIRAVSTQTCVVHTV